MVWRTLLIIIFSSLLLSACSSSSPSSSSSTPGPQESTPDFVAPTVENNSPSTIAPTAESRRVDPVSPAPTAAGDGSRPRDGGTLIRLFSDPPTLDPHLTTDTASANIIVEVFGGLVTISPELAIVPDLAESWDISPDGRTYTFHLRRNARFHDGKPVTAEDIRWSLERAADPATQSPVADQYIGDILGVSDKLSGAASTLRGVQVIDDHTLEITIDAAKSYFLAKLTYPTGFVLDRENVEGDSDWLRQPNGTGPFKLAQYDVGETIRLVRNDGYHLGPPYLDEVQFILSGGSSMLMYENDEIHLTGVGLADLDRVRDPASPLNAELHRAPPDFSVYYIGMNVNEPPFHDPKLRRALNLAIDRQTIASAVLEDRVIPATGIIPPGFPAYSPDLLGYQYDPELARQLLRESSYGDNLDELPRITLSVAGGFGASVGLDLEVILQAWEDLGVQVDIEQTEWATFLQDLHGGRFQMFQSGWVADYPDPENFLDILFHSESTNNHTNYNSPQVDAMLEQARVERDVATRFQLYNRIERLIMDEAPWVTLWNLGEGYTLIKPNVKDYYLAPIVIPKLRYVYFSE